MRHHHLKPGLLAISLLAAPVVDAGHTEEASDIWSEAKIVMSYTLDTTLNPFDLEVEVRDRTAYLTGPLPSAEDKALAEKLALAHDGVDRVESRIVLDRKGPHNQARYDVETVASDANIAAMVKAQRLWNRLTHGLDIAVSVDHGVVTLSGPVQSEREAREAARIATGTRLVDQVNDDLKVAAE